MSAEGRVAAHASDAPEAEPAWEFRWVDERAFESSAHVIGQLRWQGFDVGFSVDGLLGVDGRLAGPSLATMPPDLQHLVLQHLAHECLQSVRSGPLADLSMVSLQWHEDPLPMEGEFAFTIRREGLPGSSCGRITVLHPAGRQRLIDALARADWPLPRALSFVQGRLRIGTTCLTLDECAGLDVGDLVWLDEAEVAPSGLRACFIPSHEADAASFVRIKRHEMLREPIAVPDESLQAGAGSRKEPGMVVLEASSAEMAVQRGWLQGALPKQRLPQAPLSLPWRLCDEAHAHCEGRLQVVGRRLGLRVTRVL